MKLIDTSSWIEALRRDGDPAARVRVQALMQNGEAAWCDFVRLIPRRWIAPIALIFWSQSLWAGDGQTVYDNNCVACHGPEGAGKTPQGRKVKAKDLRESKLTDAEIATRIREGARNKSGVMVMPPLGHELTAEDIAAVIPVVKAFRPAAQP